jgi:hypothetical protein
MWTEIKNRIIYLVSKIRSAQPISDSRSSENATTSSSSDNEIKEGRPFEGARMTHNRLQSLDGSGHRQCYLEKIRQVASDSEPPEANREYWFGRDGESSGNSAVEGTAPGTESGTISSTKLAATSTTTTGTASGSNQELTQSGSRIPGIIKAIPSRARVTSTRLRAYVESLPKPEE